MMSSSLGSSSAYKVNYRDLQAAAKKLRLPGNLKHHLLLEVIEARKHGNEDTVRRILNEQKKERARRKVEKLDGKESAYSHLHMPTEKRQLGRPRKNRTQPPVEEVRCGAKPSEGPILGSSENCLRSLLTMPPPHSIQELLRQAKVPAAASSNSQAAIRAQRTNYSKRTNDVSNNFDSTDCTRQEVYQPHSMDGSILKDYSQLITRDHVGKNVGFDWNNQYVNSNSNTTWNPMNPANYVDGWNTQVDHCCSFQMKDILPNNNTLNHKKYFSYSGGDMYTTAVQNEYTNSSSQYLQDMLMGGGGHEKAMVPYPPPPTSNYPMTQHNYWVGVWDDPTANQDYGYWRNFQNAANATQHGNMGTFYPDGNTGYSPGSDTLSATEQDPESFMETQGNVAELRSSQPQYPLMYGYTGQSEGQSISQLTSENELPLIGGLIQEDRIADDLYSTFEQSEERQQQSMIDPLSDVLNDQACTMNTDLDSLDSKLWYQQLFKKEIID